jgi:hypothetical protein
MAPETLAFEGSCDSISDLLLAEPECTWIESVVATPGRDPPADTQRFVS